MRTKHIAYECMESGIQGAKARGRGCRYRLDCQVPVPPAARATCPHQPFLRARYRHPSTPARGVVDSSRRALAWLAALRLLRPGRSLAEHTSDRMADPISVPHTQL